MERDRRGLSPLYQEGMEERRGGYIHSADLALNHEQRLTSLEEQAHSIGEIVRDLNKTLNKITGQVNSIKWIISGGVGAYAIHEIGLSKVILKLVGV